jgi:hypothetical protein
MAEEFGKAGIRCVALAPTLIETPGIAALMGTSPEVAAEVRAYGEGLPLGRTGLPDDVARVAVFAASDLAGFVSGIVIPVDGGACSASAAFKPSLRRHACAMKNGYRRTSASDRPLAALLADAFWRHNRPMTPRPMKRSPDHVDRARASADLCATAR